ncbi:MAG TPA: hydantoinase/oxoprolinase family protein [Acidimicrobiales bacterium]
MGYRIGIDIGGTFTDFVLVGDGEAGDGEAGAGGVTLLEKVSSTPADRSDAVMVGLELLAGRLGLTLHELLQRTDAIVHGTTVADNTLIEMDGAVTGLITTEGFRDEIDLRRGYKEDIWDVRLPAPPPIVPRRRRVTVPERIAADGTIVTPLDEEAARAAIRRLGRQGVESVAVVTLFSFVNPVHERRLGELVAEELPGVSVCLSHEVMPKAPEFERTSTTVVNAFVGPRVTAYHDRLTTRLREAGYGRDMLVMQSSGGAMTREYMRRRPINVLASGPAGGVVGGAAIAAPKDAADLLCVDMGGTSYDVSVVHNGVAPAEPGWNWHHRYLVGLPMIDVVTLGAGGGSIASVSAGLLRVGPDSAGAEPGPVCYGRGGTRPTVSDANLVLGLLSTDAEFAGGRLQLTERGVREALAREVGDPLGYGPEEAAHDIWRVVNANMTQAVRRTTAQKGIDPAGVTMLAYGGNGPVHAAIQAQELGIRRVLVPRQSPAFSALGLLTVDPRIDEERSYLAPAADVDPGRVAELWSDLAQQATKFFEDAGFDRGALRYELSLNMRYPGQNWSMTVPVEVSASASGGSGSGGSGWDGGPLDFVDAALIAAACERFHTIHEQEHTYATRNVEPELTGVRLVTSTPVPHPTFRGGTPATIRAAAPSQRRRANLGAGFAEVDVYRGADLRAGDTVGPGIIEESFTTIVVYPGWQATVDAAGDYVLTTTT